MKNNSALYLLGTSILLLTIVVLFPFSHKNWGILSTAPARSITVTGTAETSITNQIAQFTAGVSSVDDSKERAVETVNKTIDELIYKLKEFGIEENDIQTASLVIYQDQDTVTVQGRQRLEPGKWRVSNDLTIKLRDISRANEFADVLNSSGATNVYGPNFMLDNSTAEVDKLLAEAIQKARTKAETAIASGNEKLKLGKLLTIDEVGTQQPFYADAGRFGGGGGDGASLLPGDTTVSKTVIVTFELK